MLERELLEKGGNGKSPEAIHGQRVQFKRGWGPFSVALVYSQGMIRVTFLKESYHVHKAELCNN